MIKERQTHPVPLPVKQALGLRQYLLISLLL